MAVNNLKGTADSFDGDSKENLNVEQGQQDPTIHVSGVANAKVGGQVNGGVVANSGNRMQVENQKEPESPQDL